MIIKIYDGIYGDIKFQIDTAYSIEIKNDIADISSCWFEIDVVSGISYYDRVDICMSDDLDTVIFSGFIRGISPTLTRIVVRCLGFKALLQNKHIRSDISGTSMNTIVSTALTNFSTLGETILWTSDEDITQTEPWSFSKWDTLYSIIDSFAWETYSFDYDPFTLSIRFTKNPWETREGIYTYSPYHIDSYITDVSMDAVANISNRIVDFETLAIENDDSYIQSKYGILTSNKNEWTYNWVRKDFSFKISDDSLSAGDKITIDVLGNEYISFYWEAYVVRETIEFVWWFLKKELEIATVIAKEKTLTQILRNSL